ncbi:MAG: 1-acyl-sn-glycerol-3-phosphate acyltransferase [Streptosporangiales bacterium]|nr:1-acyl-sn-glycerol-3-phosphate acyltransferase [Streptosporangiales bacterium]
MGGVRQRGGSVLYSTLKTTLKPVLQVSFKPWVTGLENVPDDGPVIIASNHLSFSDSVFLPLVVPRKMTFLAKSDYFTGRGIKGRATAAFFRGIGQLPIDRSGGRAAESALRAGLKVLSQGNVLGIYPEGTRSPDGRLHRGHTGVARIAIESNAPVVPCAMFGTREIHPPGRTMPKRGPVGMALGEPLDFSRYEGMGNDRYVLRAMTDELMYAIMKLSGQEYVDRYASTVKKEIEAAKKAERELEQLPDVAAGDDEAHPRAS